MLSTAKLQSKILATDRQLTANRLNAQKSTGPKSGAGKRRSARNSLVHGLAIPARRVAALQGDIKTLATSIAHSVGQKRITESALEAAEAHVEILRIRKVRAAIHASQLSCDELNRRLTRLERYERRAFSRLNRAFKLL